MYVKEMGDWRQTRVRSVDVAILVQNLLASWHLGIWNEREPLLMAPCYVINMLPEEPIQSGRAFALQKWFFTRLVFLNCGHFSPLREYFETSGDAWAAQYLHLVGRSWECC